MQFGLTFFPVFDPAARSAADYFAEALNLAEKADALGLEHVQVVEHHGSGYGGFSPDPVVFLAAVAARTRRIRITTGAVVPAFDHPLRLAGALSMLDALSHGRLDVGFGRAFLPAEFAAFGVSMDDSRERFTGGVDLIRRLWSQENVASDLPWAPFDPITLQPRPVQRPHPPIFIASTSSEETCAAAGRAGYHLQMVPSVATTEALQGMLSAYRTARAEAGHETAGRIQVKYTCYLSDDEETALSDGERWERNYIEHMGRAVADWAQTSSADYPGYDALVDKISRYDFARSLEQDKVLAGTPVQVAAQLRRVTGAFGDDITVSLHLNPGLLGQEKASRALDLLHREVIPALAPEPAGA
jgi:alkanesulfonate monooxygenase SsuD/methylene tetrahydromethanopterin reductase-like flavin-dependent oxidoreductase (luciferase family)